MTPDSLIAARPHFRQRQNDLYFFLSDRVFHSLSPAESAIWLALQSGPVPLKDLGDVAAVETLFDSNTIEIIEPLANPSRRHILVVEPHCDDAALSIGATMWKMRNEAEFDLLTIASRSNYTSSFHLHRNYFNRSQITAMRTAEGDLFTRHLGGHYHCAGMSEATLRYQDSDWDLDFFSAHEVPVAISNNRRAGSALLRAWIERLDEFLDGRTFDEIWIPLGAGTHSDHDLARNAALQVVLARRPRSIIRLYEDVPYGAEFREHTDRILRALENAGAKLTPWPQDVTEHFSKKLDLLTLFASQFKVGSIQAGVERSAGANANERIIEHLWTVESLPSALPQDEMWFGAPKVAEIAAKLAEFSQGSAVARRVAILAISASGRWAEDLECLSKLFPKARFVIYAGPKVCAEFKTQHDPRMELHCIDGRSGSWIKAALREVATGHRIIIAGDAIGKAKLLSVLWPLGRKAVVSEMDHFIQALEHLRLAEQ